MTAFPLRSLRLRPGEEHRTTIPVELEPFRLGGQEYLAVPANPVAELAIQRATSGDVFRLRLEAHLHGPCMRCLEDAACAVAVDAREYQDTDASAPEEMRTEYVVDDRLEIGRWARDAVAEALPDQVLCRPDCAGLCATCGKNLNEEPHDHDDEPTDPRWSSLAALRESLDE